MNVLIGLLNNTALLLALWAVFGIFPYRALTQKTILEKILAGLAISLIGLAVMFNPLPFSPGVVFDTRSILLSISGLFFGALPTSIAIILTGLYRLYQGGIGAWTGIGVILSSAGIGLAWRYLRGKHDRRMGWLELYLFGWLVHIVMLLMMFTLPREIALQVLGSIAVPVLALYPLATVLIGLLFSNQLRRTKLAQKLESSEARYRELFERASDGIFIADMQGQFLDVNEKACQMLKYTREELLARRISDIVSVEQLQTDPLQFNELFTGKQLMRERELIRKDGSKFPAEISASLLPNQTLLALVRDIARRKQAEKELRRSRENFRALSIYLKTALENERSSLATEIHEKLGQMLVGLKMDLAWFSRNRENGNELEQQARLNMMNAIVDESLEVVRRIATDLRPGLLDDLGLVPALEWLTGDFSQRTGLPCSFESQVDALELASAIATDLFRIFEESLNNIEQHADATRVESRLSIEDDKLVLEIRDDGRGVAPEKVEDQGSLGLLDLRERASQWGGKLEIDSIMGRGTRIIVHVPLEGNLG